ncbi:hypothetical protein [Bhargavaea beijingensis]|uniref:hypothetical protein n=1 Tax=Bhargavaea beijingensis TaxID=426756 RepID=UPI0022240F4D|nr:hypothetical protein [Bhargavaea beijingensis]MCW1929537.1 hypothetical protein [Bhargavaea beijingensis]
MFGWDFHHKSDRIKLFLFILAVFLLIGFSVSFIFRSLNQEAEAREDPPEIVPQSQEAAEGNPPSSLAGEEESANEYDQAEHFTDEQLSQSKEVALAFVQAFHAYDANEPEKYLEDAKPYMTNALYEKMGRNMRREPLDRSFLAVEKADVTPVVNSSSSIIRWNVMATGKAKGIDGSITPTEDWYLVSLKQVNGEWLVEDVRVNVPN